MLANRSPDWSGLRSIMLTFQIAGYLTEFTGGRAEIKIDCDAATIGEALNRLWNAHAGLRDRVLTEQGEVRPHVNIFVDSETVRRDRVLQAALADNSEICIMPAVSGGQVGAHLRVPEGEYIGSPLRRNWKCCFTV